MAAGLGFKTFNTGDVLSAADTNGYLMQGVLVFANAAARDAAITSPQEGQCCYLKDTDAVQTYSGSAWVGFDDSNAIQNSIVDAKGDIVAASGNDTPARLAVGSNGDTLVADSAATTGLIWAKPVASLSNPIVNGGMDIWQRGTSFSSPNTIYVADRWKAEGSTPACTVARQATGDTTNLPNIQYGLRFQRNSGQTNTSTVYLYTGVETANAIPFAGKAITVSFYAKCGANYSSSASALGYFLNSGTGTDENPTGSYTGNVSVASGNVTLTTTYQRFVFTGTIGATATEFKIGFNYTPSGTASTNDWFEVTGVQIDSGTWTASTAPTFRRSGNTLQGELAVCQRYYMRLTGGASSSNYGIGYAYNTTSAAINLRNAVTMRITPTVLDYSAIGLTVVGVNNYTITGLAIDAGTSGNDYVILLATGASGLTTGASYSLRNTSNVAGFIGLSAEL